MNVLVTGGTGFIGSSFLRRMSKEEAVNLTAVVRNHCSESNGAIKFVTIADISGSTDWSEALQGIDVVVHTAARAHIMDDISKNPLEQYRKVNLKGTLRLAEQAATLGVKRFIYLSSIKVCGEGTDNGAKFLPSENCSPLDPYSISKYEAEQGLRKLVLNKDMEVVIIRPPLVYGPGVKANFAKFLGLVYRGIPLPLGTVSNKRSMVSVDNLVDLMVTCLTHPKACNEIFLVSDDDDISTTELLSRIAKALKVQKRLIKVPEKWVLLIASLIGKKDVARRLFGSLQVDISKTKRLLDWKPPVRMEESLKRTAESYLESKN